MAPDVYYQVKVCGSREDVGYPVEYCDSCMVVPSQGWSGGNEPAVCFLVRNHLIPCGIGDVTVEPILGTNRLIITAWVKDELCENYKPKLAGPE